MLKVLKQTYKQDKEKYQIPKSVQNAVPVKKIYADGIFLLSNGKFSKTYKFTDINYAVASKEDKEDMFFKHSDFLNGFDSDATSKITIIHRRINKADFEKEIMLSFKEDGLDSYRREYNSMLMSKISGASSMVRELYITISVQKKNIEEARIYFSRMTTDISQHLSRLGSKLTELEATDKLRLLH
jgi:type IV secretory pathway VirB4 component